MAVLPKWALPERRRSYALTAALAGVSILLLVFGIGLIGGESGQKKGTFTPDVRLDVTGENGAVASDVELCSQKGVEILRKGGNAADAAVTVALCIGSINSQSSGIGGGGHILIRTPNGTVVEIDCRETAPKGAHKHMFDKNPKLSLFGGLAVGVPGELAGLDALYTMFGSGNIEWADLVEPVAEINELGFEMDESAFTYLPLIEKYQDFYFENGGWSWLFPDNKTSSHPSLIKRPNLAKTLRLIAQGGARVFYDPEGPIAPHLARTAQWAHGIITTEDIANYQVEIRTPLNTTFMGRVVHTTPNPTSGPAMILGLRLIEQLLTESSADLSPVDTQRLIETMKWMAAARSELGDPLYVDNPRATEITTQEWADEVIRNISDSHTLTSWRDYKPAYQNNDPHGTAHFSIVDKDGFAVAMTTTVNTPFGSLLADPVTGIILNNEMDDFSQPTTDNFFELVPSIYNYIEAGKRPLSSMCPTIIINDGKPELVIGAAGGSRILTAVFEDIVRIYGYNLSLLEAVCFPRLHHQLLPEEVSAEFGMPDSVLKSLSRKGHKHTRDVPRSVMNGIYIDEDRTLHAVSDYYRKGGKGAAY